MACFGESSFWGSDAGEYTFFSTPSFSSSWDSGFSTPSFSSSWDSGFSTPSSSSSWDSGWIAPSPIYTDSEGTAYTYLADSRDQPDYPLSGGGTPPSGNGGSSDDGGLGGSRGGAWTISLGHAPDRHGEQMSVPDLLDRIISEGKPASTRFVDDRMIDLICAVAAQAYISYGKVTDDRVTLKIRVRHALPVGYGLRKARNTVEAFESNFVVVVFKTDWPSKHLEYVTAYPFYQIIDNPDLEFLMNDEDTSSLTRLNPPFTYRLLESDNWDPLQVQRLGSEQRLLDS